MMNMKEETKAFVTRGSVTRYFLTINFFLMFAYPIPDCRIIPTEHEVGIFGFPVLSSVFSGILDVSCVHLKATIGFTPVPDG